MASKETVWVLVDPNEGLDQYLFEAIESALGGTAELVKQERSRQEESGIAERFLRSVVGDDTEQESWIERLRRADPEPAVVVTADPDDVSALAALSRGMAVHVRFASACRESHGSRDVGRRRPAISSRSPMNGPRRLCAAGGTCGSRVSR